MAFLILTRFVLVKYSRAFVERPSQGTSSLASQLTTVSLDYLLYQAEKLIFGQPLSVDLEHALTSNLLKTKRHLLG